MAAVGAYIYVMVVKAEGVIIADACGTSDPFCEVHLDADPKKVKSTKVKEKTLNPVWNQKMSFRYPANENTLATFEVFDKDFMSRDFLGEVKVDVGKVPEGTVKDVCVPLEPRAKMKTKYVGKLNTNYGKLHLKISSGNAKDCPDLVMMSATNSDFPCASPLGVGRSAPAEAGEGIQAAEAQLYIYVRPIKGQNLLPLDKNNKSDPYCVVSLNSGAETRKTDCMRATLNPVWNQSEPFSFPFNSDSRTILVELFDQDGMGFDDPMGRIMLPVDETTVQNPGEQKAGWYDVEPCPGKKSHRKAMEKRPEQLGQVYITYSIGFLKHPPASKELQPAFRTKVGKLKVEVLELRELRGVSVDELYIKCLYEGRIEQSRKNIKVRSKDEIVTVEEAWEFDVTEIMSDLLIELWDEELVKNDDRFGKVIVPCKSLWDFASEPNPRKELWFLIMPGGQKREATTYIRERMPKPIGSLKVALTFKLTPNMAAPLVYVGNKLLQDNTAVATEKEASVPNLLAEIGRLVDALLSPLTSAIAVMLYLQSWQDRKLNSAIIVLSYLGYNWTFKYCDYLAPLLLGAAVIIQGYILRMIRLKVPVFIFEDEREKLMAGITEMQNIKQTAGAEYQKALKGWTERCEEAEKDDDVEEMVVKRKNIEQQQEKRSMMSSMPGFAAWYAVQGLMRTIQTELARWSARLERLGNALCWKDEVVSLYSALIVLALSLALTVVWALLLGLTRMMLYLVPITYPMIGASFVIFILLPIHKYTAPIVATIDGILLGLPIPLQPITWNSVPLLTDVYKQQIEDLKEGGKEDLRLKAMAEAQVKADAIAKQREDEEKEWQAQEGGMEKIMERRLKDPLAILKNLYLRSPTNLDHLHRCRCVRHVIPGPMGGVWGKLPKDKTVAEVNNDTLCNSNIKYFMDHSKRFLYAKKVN